MKNNVILLLSIIFLLISCQRKKLTEINVEVPLPSNDAKANIIGDPNDVAAAEGIFEMFKLPYKYDDLAPNIDAMTMEMHYSKHYLTYTNNFNKSLAGTELESLPIEEILKKMDMDNPDMRNNAGGYYNHTLFFELLTPKAPSKPTDTLAAAINKTFGNFENFKTQFSNTAEKQFGSGWAWLVVDKTGTLQICSTPNQDNPLMTRQIIKGKPILCLDVWEHAYYLGYQYKRKKYIDAFFNIINWKKVQEKYEEAIKK